MRWTEQQLADYLERTGAPGRPNTADTGAPPFAVPANIILDLPIPPSVNRTRKLDFSSLRVANAWRNVADAYVLTAKTREKSPLKLTKVPRFELLIVFSDRSRLDLDNGLKTLIDYLRKIELIEDDSPKHLRRLVVEFGDAPMGCRITIKPLPATVNDVLRINAERMEAR